MKREVVFRNNGMHAAEIAMANLRHGRQPREGSDRVSIGVPADGHRFTPLMSIKEEVYGR